MYGRTRRLSFLPFVVVLGCGHAQSHPGENEAVPPVAGSLFDAATAGAVRGRVVWEGDLPEVPPLLERPSVLSALPGKPVTVWPNPNAPLIDPTTRAVRGAVVSLRGVDPARGRPWDHLPARVELRGRQIRVVQGDEDGAVGFVRRGDLVAMTSRDDVFHALRAGGAAFFSLTLPDPGRPRVRRMNDPGLVELSSAAGLFWMRAYLFVDDHPYYTRTDAEGRFELRGVPPGRYEAVCWLPDWRPERHDRDPESSSVTRLFFRPPRETRRAFVLREDQTLDLGFTIQGS